MKRIITISLVVGGVIALSTPLRAENDNQFGTAGAQELRIPMGAANIALAGSGLASVRGIESIFWNPAGLAASDRTQVSISHLDYFIDINVNQAAIATHLGDIGTMALSVKSVTMGDIPVTTEDDPEGTGELFAPGMTVVGLSFARQLNDRVAFGATGMFLNESIHRVNSSGVAFDFGFLYNPEWKGLRFGAVIKNYGPDMQFGGSGFDRDVPLPGVDPGIPDKTVRTESAPFELPSYVQFGMSWEALRQGRNRATLHGSYQSNNYSNDEVRFGGEYAWNESFFLRAGYVESSQDQYINDYSLGGGLKLKWGNTNLLLDYAWVNAEFFDANQWFTMTMEF